MLKFRRSYFCALLLASLGLGGCALFSGDAWQAPSPLSGPPPPPPIREKHESQGGFTVLVEAPGCPAAARVSADISAYAQGRGFVRQSARPMPTADGQSRPLPAAERFMLGQVVLDVTYRAADLRMVAYLHSANLSRKFADEFFRAFDQAYASRYGEQDPIVESEYIDG